MNLIFGIYGVIGVLSAVVVLIGLNSILSRVDNPSPGDEKVVEAVKKPTGNFSVMLVMIIVVFFWPAVWVKYIVTK